MKGQQQHVVKRFTTALEVILRTLAENAAVGESEGNKVVNLFGEEDEATEPSDGDIEAKHLRRHDPR
jgi:chaperonin GroEL (HSP60 family)